MHTQVCHHKKQYQTAIQSVCLHQGFLFARTPGFSKHVHMRVHIHTHTHKVHRWNDTVPVLKFMEKLTGKSTIGVKALKLVSFPKVAWGGRAWGEKNSPKIQHLSRHDRPSKRNLSSQEACTPNKECRSLQSWSRCQGLSTLWEI